MSAAVKMRTPAENRKICASYVKTRKRTLSGAAYRKVRDIDWSVRERVHYRGLKGYGWLFDSIRLRGDKYTDCDDHYVDITRNETRENTIIHDVNTCGSHIIFVMEGEWFQYEDYSDTFKAINTSIREFDVNNAKWSRQRQVRRCKEIHQELIERTWEPERYVKYFGGLNLD